MNQPLPKWVQQGAIAYYKPGCILFPVLHCRQQRSTGKILLLDAPKGVQGCEYMLDECEPGTLKHLSSVALMTWHGKPVTITREGNLYRITNGTRIEQVRIDPVREAAESLSAFFNGEVVEGVLF